jgi:glycosyltransferase involved in cell wall biosynthesis
MKRLLIISPYFAPCNTPDMQRIRTSLPYFKEFGWEAEAVTVDPLYCDAPMDELLLQTIPADIKIHPVKAFKKNLTAKFGFGNVAFRSYRFYRKKVDELLQEKKYDLIYFSTTQFPICVLGAYWQKRFGVPYVIDMQDPWYSNYYDDKPKEQQPPKYKLSNTLHKYLEPIAMKKAGGLISVSERYIADLKNRYPQIKNIPEATITFGSFEADMDIAIKNQAAFDRLLDPDFKNVVYIGRGGMDMHRAIIPLFEALNKAIAEQPEIYNKIKLYFIGTSYAPKGEGQLTILPLAKQLGVESSVVEITDRISYFHTLATLLQADALFIPGSDDPKYTPSKLYPYLLAKKPLLAIFNAQSPALNILNDYGVPAYSYNGTLDIEPPIMAFFSHLINGAIDKPVYNEAGIEKYSAKNMTKMQCDLFDSVLANIN